jgi:hypothetical protein
MAAAQAAAPVIDSFELDLLAYEQHLDHCQQCEANHYCATGHRLLAVASRTAGRLADRNREERPLRACPNCSSELCPHLHCRTCGHCNRCSAREAIDNYKFQKGNGKHS